MFANTPPHLVLRSDTTIQALYDDWMESNKSRVYTKSQKCCSMQREAIEVTKPSQATGKPVGQPTSQPIRIETRPTSMRIHENSTNPYVLASLRNVFASRKDIPSDASHTISTPTNVPEVCTISDKFAEKESMYATTMCDIEKDMMMHVCTRFLVETPPYSTYTHTDPGSTDTKSMSICPKITPAVPIASACCAHVKYGSGLTGKIYLPICAPSPDQISKCQKNALYNSNIQNNIATALQAANVNVVMCTNAVQTPDTKTNEPPTNQPVLPKSLDRNTVYMDSGASVHALATPDVLEDIIFGDSRTTSSTGFAVCRDVGATYARAIEAFEKYGSTRVGNNVTLTASFFKKLPMVISMSCPEMDISEVVTGFSGAYDNAKLGPNHATRMVEVMTKMTPFVNKCCESYMGLCKDTVEDLVEDVDMPVATVSNIEHCFAYDPQCGVSAYVGSHDLKLDASIVNTHVGSRVRVTSSEHTQFPVTKKFVVHIVALFSGAVVPSENNLI
jgi:hypothetical protein